MHELIFALLIALEHNTALPTVGIVAPKATLTLEVASTESEREAGLMNRTALSPHTGMIFVFRNDAPVSFWMKETLVSLDMVYLGADGTVRKVFARVQVLRPGTPDSMIPLETARGKYVIELPAGEAAADGIVKGLHLQLPPLPKGDNR